MNKEIRKKSTPSIGIAFGGGAVRGFVHIGVLEALSEAGDERLMPQLIAGTSTGSIMGALYASGLSVETIKAESEKTSLMDMEQRDTLIAHGKAAMKARLEDLIRRVENSKRTDEQA